jgi:hypothetical protein
MYPLSAIARTFNRNTATIPKLSTHSTKPITTSFLTNLNFHLARYSNNDNDIEHFEPEFNSFYSNISTTSNINKSSGSISIINTIHDEENYLTPYLM